MNFHDWITVATCILLCTVTSGAYMAFRHETPKGKTLGVALFILSVPSLWIVGVLDEKGQRKGMRHIEKRIEEVTGR